MSRDKLINTIDTLVNQETSINELQIKFYCMMKEIVLKTELSEQQKYYQLEIILNKLMETSINYRQKNIQKMHAISMDIDSNISMNIDCENSYKVSKRDNIDEKNYSSGFLYQYEPIHKKYIDSLAII